MEQQIRVMLDMQEAMNRKVHPQWRQQNFAWYRAIWVECAELLDHYGWKWWKQQIPDLEQVKLELVDIWHFGMSHMMVDDLEQNDLAARLAGCFVTPVEPGNFRDDLETFAARCLATKGFDTPGFVTLLADIELHFDELYTRYIGKNVLNTFRQNNGYQKGSYQKIWAGREDNEHLSEIVVELDAGHENFKEHVYEALTRRYPSGLLD